VSATSVEDLDLTIDELRERAAQRQAKCLQLKEMIVERLDLPVDPSWITDDQPLVGRGLELDSVDTLELIIGIEAVFGVSLTDEEVGAFGSVSRLADRLESDRPLDPPVMPGG
jgi:acyl carrier protein